MGRLDEFLASANSFLTTFKGRSKEELDTKTTLESSLNTRFNNSPAVQMDQAFATLDDMGLKCYGEFRQNLNAAMWSYQGKSRQELVEILTGMEKAERDRAKMGPQGRAIEEPKGK